METTVLLAVTMYDGSFCVINYVRLTLQPATTPSPPAQTMVSFTWEPHQSYLVQVAWSTTGRRACCRMSAMGPPAGWKRDEYKLKFDSGKRLVRNTTLMFHQTSVWLVLSCHVHNIYTKADVGNEILISQAPSIDAHAISIKRNHTSKSENLRHKTKNKFTVPLITGQFTPNLKIHIIFNNIHPSRSTVQLRKMQLMYTSCPITSMSVVVMRCSWAERK